MKKTVTGLNLDNHIKAVAVSVASAAALFLTYARLQSGNMSVFSTVLKALGEAEFKPVYISAVGTLVFALAAAVMGLISLFKTTVKGVRAWQWVQAASTFFWTTLMFTSRASFKALGLSDSFLNKDLSFGFVIGLLASLASLVLVMKVTKTNPGYIVLTVLGAIWLFPIVWIVLTAFRAEQGYYVGYFIPHGFTFDNFINLFNNQSVLPFGRWWVNTFIVAACSCVINTLIVLGTSYVLSRTRFAGRKAFMNVLMIIGMFPGFMSLIAVYNILKGIGINQSLFALIVVSAAGAAMGYHVSKGFFDTIPKAIDEAAIIDGASRLQIFLHVTLPLSKSIIVYTVLGAFLGAWSDYIFPSMLFGDKQSSYTVAVGLFWLTDFKRIDTYYTQFAAGAVVVAVPIVILFIWLQRFYVEGLSGSVKG